MSIVGLDNISLNPSSMHDILLIATPDKGITRHTRYMLYKCCFMLEQAIGSVLPKKTKNANNTTKIDNHFWYRKETIRKLVNGKRINPPYIKVIPTAWKYGQLKLKTIFREIALNCGSTRNISSVYNFAFEAVLQHTMERFVLCGQMTTQNEKRTKSTNFTEKNKT